MGRFLLIPALALTVSFGFMPSASAVKTVKVKKTTTKTTVVKKKKKKKRPAARKAPPRKRIHTGPTFVDKRIGASFFGLRLGLTSAEQLCDCVDEPDSDSISGGLIGVTKDVGINHALSYRLEGLLVQKGAEVDITVPTADGGTTRDTLDLTMTYLELGAQLLMRFNVNRRVAAYFGGGPYMAVLMDTDARVDGKKARGFDKDHYESGDYGLSLTGGAIIGVSAATGMLTSVQFTYSHGLGDIFNHGNIPNGSLGSDEDDTLHNRAMYLSLGVHF